MKYYVGVGDIARRCDAIRLGLAIFGAVHSLSRPANGLLFLADSHLR